ncbi:MAG: ABC transporter permease [Ignavibacteria bacterium]|nr:ABC transporter permease [Ignavibacteria bacterium]
MLIVEIIKLALNTIRANKLRAFLTLSGIVIGVFSIIAIMTALSALQAGIESGLSQLGSNSFQIQKFPAMNFGGPGSRKYRNRPDITYEQGLQLMERATNYKYISIELWKMGKIFKYGKYVTNPNMSLCGGTTGFTYTNDYVIRDGRFFSEKEVQSASPVAVIGLEVVSKLFPKENPINKRIILDGHDYQVIGILEGKGESFGQSLDNLAIIPITRSLQIYGREESLNIAIQAKDKASYNDCVENIISVFRVIRGVKPGEENNFEIFSNDSLIESVNSFTKYFKYGAGFISFIALLAAGVGIMNIMLVSVTERTKEIGIRKAIGAKNSNILFQFIVEAIILCQVGGIVGIILGVFSGNLLGIYLKTNVVIPYDWVIIGFVICTLVGVIFGVYPAYKASRLNPIDALRYE